MKPATVFLGEMTNPEVEAFLRQHHTVIVPTGATEQHGPHLPLDVDLVCPRGVARGTGQAVPETTAAPAPELQPEKEKKKRRTRSSRRRTRC